MKRESFFKGLLMLVIALTIIVLFSPGLAVGQDSMNVEQTSVIMLSWDETYDVAVSGNYAYLATGETGLRVFDISDPASPEEVYFIDVENPCEEVRIQMNALFLMTDSDIILYDITDPVNPQYLSTIDISWYNRSFQVELDLLVLGSRAGGGGTYTIELYDIGDLENPLELSSVELDYSGDHLEIYNELLYVIDSESEVTILDISQPQQPYIVQEISTYMVDFRIYDEYMYGIHYQGTSSGNITIMSLLDPLYPERTGNCQISYLISDLEFTGNYACGTSHAQMHEFCTIDISDPYTPGTPYFLDLPYYGSNLYLLGDYAYTACYDSGMQIVDISDPNEPFITGSGADVSAYATYCMTEGNYLYIADNPYFRIFDISDPALPIEIGYAKVPCWGSVSVQDNYAFIAPGWYAFYIYDISDPTDPQEILYYYGTGQDVEQIIPDGDVIYVSCAGYLKIYNIEDILNPVQIASLYIYPYSSPTFRMVLQNDYIYSSYHFNGLIKIIDVQNPQNPVEVGSINLVGAVYDVDVSGNTLYAANAQFGVAVIDVSNPFAPDTITFIDTPYSAKDCYIDGDTLYIADYHSVWMYDVSSLEEPVEIGYYGEFENLKTVCAQDGYCYALDIYYLRTFQYLESPGILETPEVTISMAGTILTLNWTTVEGAQYYDIYCSDNPYSEIEEMELIGTINNTTYNMLILNEDMLYFRVIARN